MVIGSVLRHLLDRSSEVEERDPEAPFSFPKDQEEEKKSSEEEVEKSGEQEKKSGEEKKKAEKKEEKKADKKNKKSEKEEKKGGDENLMKKAKERLPAISREEAVLIRLRSYLTDIEDCTCTYMMKLQTIMRDMGIH